MEPADEELQQLSAPPARAPTHKARAVVACVALASTALLFAVSSEEAAMCSRSHILVRQSLMILRKI